MPTQKQLLDLQRKETWVLQSLLGCYSIPHASVRAVCGMASVEPRQDLRVWHLYREFVQVPPPALHREVMQKEARHCGSLGEADPRRKRLWLSHVNDLLGVWGGVWTRMSKEGYLR